MFTRVIRVAAYQIRSVTRTGNNHRRADNAETTELHTLTARSHEDMPIDDTNAMENLKESKSTNSSQSPGLIRRYRHRWSGWRFGVLNFAMWATVVFLINLIVTIWGSVSYRATQGVLDEAECGHIKKLNSGLHVLINVLSTILLSGSNYTMQCLSAPTRAEVDMAHGARRWLDIGVPSFRNLRRISRRRLTLWLLLAVSSLPLHLLYNSAVHASIAANSYMVFAVSQAFVDDPTCQNCTTSFPREKPVAQLLSDLWATHQKYPLDKLKPVDCINAYGTMVQSVRRNVFVVTANENVGPERSPLFMQDDGGDNKNILTAWTVDASEGLSQYQFQKSTIGWMCSGLPDHEYSQPCINRLGEVRSSHPWMLLDQWPVDYCLSERAEPRCRLHFNPVIAIIVTVLNFFKALLMFYIAYSTKDNPLMTIGDAVASFLDDRDITSKDLGLFDIGSAKRGYSAGARTWNDPRQRWKNVTSKTRRILTLILFAIALITVIALLIWGIRDLNYYMATSTHDVLRLGFGAVDPRTLISSNQFPTDMGSLALLANLPQVILSFLYFSYNSLFTAMLMGYEWVSYAHKRKGLRTSRKPAGQQRSTYFLQLPYRFGVPLVVLSGVMHWLVSQSIFVVAFDMYDQYGKPITVEYFDAVTRTVGYSPAAMLAVIIVGVAMVAAIVGFGFIPYKTGMPLAGSCSLAISAACHPAQDSESDDSALSEQKLQWGVVSISADGIGHCAFSSQEVQPLIKGQIYA